MVVKTIAAIKRRVAIVGAGMTKFVRRAKETGKELAYEAAKMALDSAGLTLKDVDAVVIGSAPDAFDGVHMKGEYLADGSGAWRKPCFRQFDGGSTGVGVVPTAFWTVASGLSDVCLVVCEEKMSSCLPHPQYAFLTIYDPILVRPIGLNVAWNFAFEMKRYMHVYNVRHEQIALVSVKNKRNALDHPCAQLAAKITVEDVLKSEVIADPVRRLDISPTSDGAVAIILAHEGLAKRLTDVPVWITGIGSGIDTQHWTDRDLAYCKYLEEAARMAYRMAGIRNPRKEVDVANPYDPFDYKELQHAEALLLFKPGEAPRATEEGVTERDGDMPLNPDGGLLGVGNPISAAGLMRVAEIFWQLRGEAGKRQVKKDAVIGVAHAWGELMQKSSVVVMQRG